MGFQPNRERDRQTLADRSQARSSPGTRGDPTLALYLAFDRVVRGPRNRWPRRIEAVAREVGARALRSLIERFVHSDDGMLAGVTQLDDSFELREELGRGTSALVWSAWDTRLDRAVCLKVFKSSKETHGAWPRVCREASQTSEVISPHVVQTYGAGRCRDTGLYYIAMELCGDFSSATPQVAAPLADTSPRDRAEAVRWVLEAARGLQATHARGLFHGDIKPENVLVRPVSRTAVVIDFGLWCGYPPGRDPRNGWTDKRPVVLGTPPYMAPEQARGLSPYLDPTRPGDREQLTRIDVYCLGAMLYEACTGHAPYLGPGHTMVSNEGILEQLRGRSSRLPRCCADDALQRIVSRATAPEPSDRYPSCRALADDLARHLQSTPPQEMAVGVPSRPPGGPQHHGYPSCVRGPYVRPRGSARSVGRRER